MYYFNGNYEILMYINTNINQQVIKLKTST